MSIKKLITEKAKELKIPLDVTTIFENVELSDDIKLNLTLALESAVRSSAVDMTAELVHNIAEEAAVEIEEGIKLREAKIVDDLDAYLTSLTDTWLTENEVKLTSSIKSNLFESMVVGLKTLFVENNIEIPEDSINIIEEINEDNAELSELNDKLIKENSQLSKQLNTQLMCEMVDLKTKDLTESIKEKVFRLASVIPFNESFESKLDSIIELHSNIKIQSKEQKDNINEQNDLNSLNYNNSNENKSDTKKEPKVSNSMLQYILASKL